MTGPSPSSRRRDWDSPKVAKYRQPDCVGVSRVTDSHFVGWASWRQPVSAGDQELQRGRCAVIFGLAAALGWGISTVAAAAATGRGGTYVALLIAQ